MTDSVAVHICLTCTIADNAVRIIRTQEELAEHVQMYPKHVYILSALEAGE